MDRQNLTCLKAVRMETLPFALRLMIHNDAHGTYFRMFTLLHVYIYVFEHSAPIRVANLPLQAESLQPCRLK